MVPELNLSQLKVLRSLEIGDWVGNPHHYATVMEMFSTITSLVFSELVITLTPADEPTRLPQEVTLFETLRKMNEVRPFKLVFLLKDVGFHQEEVPRELVDNLALVIAQGLLDFLDTPPSVRIARSCRELFEF